VRQWALKFGLKAATRIRARVSSFGDKWHLGEVVITIKGKKHWLWRAVEQNGYVLDVFVKSRRNTQSAARLMRKLPRKNGRTPRVIMTEKLKSYATANRRMGLKFEHRQAFAA
jgi:putative transposase